MKIIQSLWTKNLSDDVLKKNQTYYELSAKYLKDVGYPIELYTDSKGAEIFKKSKFYDKIHTDLDHVNNFNSELWSAVKIYSLLLSKSAAIHVDGDVFFRNPSFFKNIINQNWDILVQSKEVYEHYYYQYDKSIETFNTLCKLDDPWIAFYLKYYNYTYNCGVLGFKSFVEIEKFSKMYFNLFKILNDSPELIYRYNDLKDNRAWVRGAKVNINCILEQVQLTFFSNYYNLFVKELIPMSSWHDPKWQYHQNFQNDINYEHLAGKEKFLNESVYQQYKEELEKNINQTEKYKEILKWKNY